MKTIWKYNLVVTDEQSLNLPDKAVILSVQLQHGSLCLWAEVDTNNTLDRRTILIYGTGHPMSECEMRFINTVQFNSGLVFHIFEKL